MKFITFAAEVLRVPESVTFWIMHRTESYTKPFSVNMSPLEIDDTIADLHILTPIIRSEDYKTLDEAQSRLKDLLKILNSPYPL